MFNICYSRMVIIQKGAEKFLEGGGGYPVIKMISRHHAPGSLEGGSF